MSDSGAATQEALGAPPAGPIGHDVEIRGLVKVYPDGNVRALDGLDLHVDPGEFVAITGPSGCGKSTLLHLLAGLDRPSDGSVRVGSFDLMRLHNLPRYRRLEVGLVFQLHNLLPHLSVAMNVELAMFSTHHDRTARRQRAEELLRDVDLAGCETRLPTQLSGGERQRVAIARALANDPRLLLADEPTGNLDTRAAARILDLLHDVNRRGVTILLVTHDATLAAAADRMVEMRDGRALTTTPSDGTII